MFEFHAGLSVTLLESNMNGTVHHKFLYKDEEDNQLFLKLDPARSSCIAQMLLACHAEGRVRTTQMRVLFQKGNKGHKFLQDIRRRRDTAVKLQYRVKGPRLMARAKVPRAQQMLAKTICVAMPQVADHPSIEVAMRYQTAKNRCTELWVECTPEKMEYLAKAFASFMSSESMKASQDDTEERVVVAGEEEPDDVEPQDPEIHVGSGSSAATPVAPATPIAPAAPPVAEVACVASVGDTAMNPLQRAFMKGARLL